MIKVLDKPASKKDLKWLERKKMTMFTSLSSFITSKTQSSFHKLDADEGFLTKDPALWEEDDQFKDAWKWALGLWVVNNAAEWGITLVQRYLGSKLATQMYYLQLVHHHRKLVGQEKEDLQKKGFWMETVKTVCFGFLISFFKKMWDVLSFFFVLKVIRNCSVCHEP